MFAGSADGNQHRDEGDRPPVRTPAAATGVARRSTARARRRRKRSERVGRRDRRARAGSSRPAVAATQRPERRGQRARGARRSARTRSATSASPSRGHAQASGRTISTTASSDPVGKASRQRRVGWRPSALDPRRGSPRRPRSRVPTVRSAILARPCDTRRRRAPRGIDEQSTSRRARSGRISTATATATKNTSPTSIEADGHHEQQAGDRVGATAARARAPAEPRDPPPGKRSCAGRTATAKASQAAPRKASRTETQQGHRVAHAAPHRGRRRAPTQSITASTSSTRKAK